MLTILRFIPGETGDLLLNFNWRDLIMYYSYGVREMEARKL